MGVQLHAWGCRQICLALQTTQPVRIILAAWRLATWEETRHLSDGMHICSRMTPSLPTALAGGYYKQKD